MRLIPDVAVVAKDLFEGYLGFRRLLASLKATNVEFVFSAKDPGSVSSLN